MEKLIRKEKPMTNNTKSKWVCYNCGKDNGTCEVVPFKGKWIICCDRCYEDWLIK